MRRAKSTGNGRLEEALATLMRNQAILVQVQAAYVAQMAENDARRAEMNARMAEMDRTNTERFVRIEALLLENNRLLEALPDAILDKLGFKAPTPDRWKRTEDGTRPDPVAGRLSRAKMVRVDENRRTKTPPVLEINAPFEPGLSPTE